VCSGRPLTSFRQNIEGLWSTAQATWRACSPTCCDGWWQPLVMGSKTIAILGCIQRNQPRKKQMMATIIRWMMRKPSCIQKRSSSVRRKCHMRSLLHTKVQYWDTCAQTRGTASAHHNIPYFSLVDAPVGVDFVWVSCFKMVFRQ
jgi:hypothetical protein